MLEFEVCRGSYIFKKFSLIFVGLRDRYLILFMFLNVSFIFQLVDELSP